METVSRSLAAVLSVWAGACLVSGCSRNEPMRVHSYWGPATKYFEPGSSFGWVTGNGPDSVDPPIKDAALHQTVCTLLEAKITARGYPKETTARSDFWIRYRAGTQIKQAETGNESWDEGALALDVIDPTTGQIIWCGLAEAKLDPSRPPDERKRLVDDAIRNILEGFQLKNR